jgi:hypothetical protein
VAVVQLSHVAFFLIEVRFFLLQVFLLQVDGFARRELSTGHAIADAVLLVFLAVGMLLRRQRFLLATNA